MPRSLWQNPWGGSLLLLIGTIALLQLDLGQAPEFDELYHVLAAQGWLATGSLSIAEGTYERVSLYTHLIARVFQIFGTSLEVARQPSVIACALLVFSVFQWSFRTCGAGVAWLAAGLLALSPFLVDTAQFVRFYGLQALIFFISAVAVYSMLDKGRRLIVRGVFGALALVMLAAATYLQPVSVVGAVGLGIWAAIVMIVALLKGANEAFDRRFMILLGIIVLSIIALVGLMMTDAGVYLIHKYSWSPLWNQSAQDWFAFYHVWLALYYPTLWTIFPLLLIVAVAVKPRPALFAACIFIIAFLLHSFAAVKGLRYIFYAMPFLFILFGIAVMSIFERLIRFIREQMDIAGREIPRWLENILRPVLWIGMAGFLILANAAFVRSATMLAGITIPPENPPTRWHEVKPKLQPWLDTADVVITSNELHALYYLGDYDLLFSHSRIEEVGGDQFNRDHRTGRPVIDDRAIIKELITCYPKGLIISPAFRWRNAAQIDNETADMIIRLMEPLDLPANSRMRAYVWDRTSEGQPISANAECPTW